MKVARGRNHHDAADADEGAAVTVHGDVDDGGDCDEEDSADDYDVDVAADEFLMDPGLFHT